ncbi:MAG: hypothetical protein HC802_16920 [Caldilineaceae bacterium]|nr:hypothetical protein [Caldilineaceae bacterium]
MRFVDFLDGKVRSANDTIDLSFLRVQTDIYRLRQQVLGADEATRLATSPVLAAIAKGESAYATRKDLQSFVAGLKESAPVGDGPIGDVNIGDETAPLAAPAADAAPQPAADIGSNLFVSGARIQPSLGGQSAFVDPRIVSGAGSSIVDRGIVIERAAPSIGDAGRVVAEPTPLRPPTRDAITEQSPIVGVGYDSAPPRWSSATRNRRRSRRAVRRLQPNTRR